MEDLRYVHQQQLAYPMQLTAKAAEAYSQMTPFAAGEAAGEEALCQQALFDCQTDFAIHCWQRCLRLAQRM